MRTKRSTRWSAVLLVLLAVAGSRAPAQSSQNVVVLANVAPEGRTTNKSSIIYNDIWGYTAPNGNEYAIVGSRTGTYVFDCTNPAQPQQRGFIAASASGWVNSSWRDMKVFGNYAYVVTDGSRGRGGAGLQIIDLTNPDLPSLVKTWQGGWQHSHNIAMDEQNGIAYVCGTGGSRGDNLYVLDVKTDPVNPSLILNARVNYIHDLTVQGGVAYCSELYSNRLTLYDVSNLPTMTTISRTVTPGSSISHNTAITSDGEICLTTNETSGAPVGFFDVTTTTAPRQLATWRTGISSTIPHNAYTKDRLAHVAYYTEGYQVLDISDPANPALVGYYDTWTGSSGGFAGAWGLYVQQPSGVIYVSDIQNGLFVMEATAATRRYGKATPGTNGAPIARTFGSAYTGNANFRFVMDDAPANAPCYLVIGFNPAAINVAGLEVNVSLVPPFAIIPLATDANGRAELPLAVPTDPAVAGTVVRAQWFAADAGGPLGLTASRGLELEVFVR